MTPLTAIVDTGPSVSLGAFGKHRGWADHIEDLGLDTDRLIWSRRLLYTEGIRRVLDQGLWSRQEEGDRDEGYAHTLAWKTPDGLLVGRLWSSRDGSGRDGYPMVLVAHTRAVPSRVVFGEMLDRLRSLEERCKAAESREAVLQAFEREHEELKSVAGFRGAASGDPLDPPGAAARLAADSAVGREGLVRILYQIERDFRAFLQTDSSETSIRARISAARAQHARVPRVHRQDADEAALWLGFTETLFAASTPVLILLRDDRTWVDVIAGEPGPEQVVCLQLARSAVPIASDVPYTIDSGFTAHADEVINTSQTGGRPEHDPGAIRSGAAAIQRAVQAVGGTTRDRRIPAWLWAAGAVLLAAVALIVVLLLPLGGNG